VTGAVERILPDFVVVGAPKCGTTSLDRYLSQHPDVFMARKEQHYWGSDLEFRWPRITTEAYSASLATDAPARVRGEASVWYLYSKLAAAEIHAANPDAKIIAILRNPPDMISSLHNQHFNAGGEDIPDFADALAAEADRREGRRLPRGNGYPWSLQYREVARYADQVERYLDLFGRDQVLVVLYDDFAADPSGTFRTVCRFLGVDESFAPTLDVHNASKRLRSRALMFALELPSPAVRWAGRILIPHRRLRRRVLDRLVPAVRRVNVEPVRRPPLDPALRASLVEDFRPDIERLSTLIGRNLDHWLDPDPRSSRAPSSTASASA
jgi:hypothetical protein